MDNLIIGPMELSQYLGVPISWVYSQTRLGSRCPFPFRKIGRYVRFYRSEIDQWLESQKHGYSVGQ